MTVDDFSIYRASLKAPLDSSGNEIRLIFTSGCTAAHVEINMAMKRVSFPIIIYSCVIRAGKAIELCHVNVNCESWTTVSENASTIQFLFCRFSSLDGTNI